STNRTLTFGTVETTDDVVVPAGVSEVAGTVTLGTPLADLSGSFVVQSNTTPQGQELLFGASGVDIFLGDRKGTTDLADDVGVQLSGLTLIAVIDPQGRYAFDGSGAATLVGIPDLTLSGALGVQKNTSTSAVNRTVTIGGVTKTLNIPAGASQVGGAITLGVAGFVDFSGQFAVNQSADRTKVTFGAANINAFLGSGRDTPDTHDDVGVEVRNGSLGVVVYTADSSKFALQTSGDFALVGLDGLVVSGDMGVNLNRTGAAVNETVSLPGGASVNVKFDTAERVEQFRGDATFEVGGVFTLHGAMTATKQANNSVLVDLADIDLGLVLHDEEIFSIGGSARFSIGASDGFRLLDMGVDYVAAFGVSLDVVAGALPNFGGSSGGSSSGGSGGSTGSGTSGGGSSSGGSSGGGATGGSTGGTMSVQLVSLPGLSTDTLLLNRRKYVDVTFVPAAGATVDATTILDSAAEFSISGDGVLDAQLDKVEQRSADTFRYYFIDKNTTNTDSLFKAGAVAFNFSAGGWKDSTGASSPLSTLTATLRDAGATGSKALSAGSLSIVAPHIGIEDFQFKPLTDADGNSAGAELVITIGLGADRATLAFGGANSQAATQQASSGTEVTLTDLFGAFDVAVDLDVPGCLGDLLTDPLACITGGGLT
ncbi:MAG TPA: hypothetical protein PLV92_18235, partial [Pirellulaceae bacterium]|nr:hypothetical protein [Pirellulaceae bacterium]